MSSSTNPAANRKRGELFVGESVNTDDGERNGNAILLDSADFTTHGVIVGMTGSGKTGLGVVLLEEALLSGIPVLAIDPKGDLGNLALTFPDLSAADFEPWMDEGTARREQSTVADMAAKTAETWKKGLAGWGMDGESIARLKNAAETRIYTPGSTTGIPVNALGRLSVPPTNDPGARQDEVDATVSGLLGLIGVESDPLSGREHILLANLITRAWDEGNDLDLPTLLGQLLDPPIRKLGVLELDTFFPAKDRQALAMKLNGLLASPSFAAWAEGEPLDMATMLWGPDGDPRAAVVSLGHLDEAERHFAVSLILSRLISWMRSQAGTGELRVLVYIDEVMGLAPPNGNPPPKKPILTLLKQARAFGVGLVLSTQNPVDLDYKAISNAGTWLIGRLQTEQDKNRLVDGLRSADGAVDVGEVERMISGLGKRQFVLRTTRTSDLPLFTTRWAMSYLAGPLTREQIGELMADKKAAATPVSSAAAPADSPAAAPAESPAETASPSAAELADDETTIAPEVPAEFSVRYIHASAPWMSEVGADPGSSRLQLAIAARVSLLFDETKADLRHVEEWESIIPVVGSDIDVDAAIDVDFDDRDFTETAPDGARYVLPEFNLTKTALKEAQTDLRAKLYTGETFALFQNPELKLWSRPGESEVDFKARAKAAAEVEADIAVGKIREKLEKKHESVRDALAKAEDRVAELEEQAKGRKTQNVIDIGTSILGGLLGGRKSSRQLASAARRAASGSRHSGSIDSRLESAENRVAEKIDDLNQLELELQEAMIEIDDDWNTKAEAVEAVEVPLEKTDITIDDFIVVWMPV